MNAPKLTCRRIMIPFGISILAFVNPAFSEVELSGRILPETDIYVNAELMLHWSDLLSRPGHTSQSKPLTADYESSQLSENYQSETTRTPGLAFLRLNTTWKVFDYSSLNLSFRPDALIIRDSSTNSPKNLDTRSGTVYKSLDDPHFLESYMISSQLSLRTGWSLGVVSELLAPKRSYPTPLEFGLTVLLPTNIFRGSFYWTTEKLTAKSLQDNTLHTDFELFAYQGPDDRGEMIADSDRSFDHGLVSKDPYHGVGFKIKSETSQLWSLGLLLGYHESGYSGQQQRTFYTDLRFEHQFMTGLLQHLISWNTRMLRDNWIDSETSISPLLQVSFSLTDKVRFSNKNSVLTGLHIGRSERHNEADIGSKHNYYGHQVEIGWESLIHHSLTFRLLMSEEHRQRIESNGDMEPGFKNSSGSKKMLRRIGLELQFSI